MRRILSARWFWVVVVFAVINILGLLEIVSLLHSSPEGTAAPQALLLNRMEQTGLTPDHRLSLALEFNDEVDPSDIREHLTLVTNDGKKVAYELGTYRPAQRITVRTDSFEAAAIVATLSKGLPGASGQSRLSRKVAQSMVIDTEIHVTSVDVDPYEHDSLRIRVYCTQGMDPKTVQDFIRLEPETSFTASTDDYGVEISGPFEHGKRYTVRFLKGMKAASGALLKKEIVRTVVTPDMSPTLRFKTQGVYLSKEGMRVLPLETANVKEVDVTIEQVYENNIIHYVRTLDHGGHPRELGRIVAERKYAVGGTPNQLGVTNLDLKDLLGADAYGVFVVTAADTQDDEDSERQLVLITDMGLSVKRTDSEMLVWVNSVSTAEPVAGAVVSIFTRTNQKILDGTTDADGIARFRLPEGSDDRIPFAVVATKSGDAAVIKLDDCALDTSMFDTAGRPYLSRGYHAFVYTDRGIYRPGEQVHLRAIVRAPGPNLPERFPMQFRISRPDGTDFKTYSGQLSAWGSVETDCDMPSYAMLGRYRADLTLPGGEAIGSESFHVEEFIPQRIKLELNADERRYRPNENIEVKVKAAHLFGAPAVGLKIHARCTFSAADFAHADYNAYRFSDSARAFAEVATDLGEATLDEKGERVFTIQAPKGLKPPSALEVAFQATVEEVGGRAVTAVLIRDADVYQRYVGLAREGTGYARIGQEEKLTCALIRPDGSRIREAELKAVVYRVVWNTVLKLDSGHYRYQSERDEKQVAQRVCQVRDGMGSLSYAPDAVGEYLVRVSDEQGGASAGLEFYCGGEGDVPWSMEKPDRLELVADKESYSPGDTARVLIKSPFTGMALVTVEGDHIHSAQVLRLDKNTQEVSIPIEPSFGPNVYCAVSVIRKVAPEARWSTHRAHGVLRITLDQKPRKLSVGIDCPDEVRPGRTLRVRLDVKNYVGAGTRSEVTLAAVDEGICQLTRFETPDPWAFFYSARQLEVETCDIYSRLMPEWEKKKVGSDSETGGDRAGADREARRLLNPVLADRVKPIALWKSGIETNAEGRAEVDLEIPEQFTGRLRLMAIAAAAQEFGSADRPLLVKKPLMLQTSLPRFLAPADECEVPVTVFNHMGRAALVALRTDKSANLEFLTGDAQPVEIPQGGEKTVVFKVRASRSPGVANFRVEATSGEEHTSEEVALTVRPTATLQFVAGSGTVFPSGDGAADVKLRIPGGWMPTTERYWLSFSSRPALKLGGALRYVLRYPYGCVEQTTSGAFPLLYLSDIAALADPERFQKEEVAVFVQAGIDRLLSMQSYQGGFCMWPDGSQPYPWGSVYATHFLVEADKAGHQVPKDRLEAALKYLERLLSYDEGEESALPLKAYACFVLAQAGRPSSSWTFQLYEERDQLPAYSRFHVAAALELLHEHDLANTITRVEELPPLKSMASETGGLLYSPVRERAVVLSAYLDMEPENPRVPVLVQKLEGAMKSGRWDTTQENAFALMALGKYARYLGRQKADYHAEVFAGDVRLAAFTHNDQVQLQPENVGGQEIGIRMKGAGPLYYYWAAEGVPQSGDVAEKDEGLVVRRRFLSREGKNANLSDVPHGELLIVELSIKSAQPLDNIVITDLLPAGLEIENPRLAGSESISTAAQDALQPMHVDMRDDRLLVFTNLNSDREYHYRYVVRAVTRGRFRLPPVTAFCMYQPEISSVHGTGEIRVVDGH
jgi:hypothetical protein